MTVSLSGLAAYVLLWAASVSGIAASSGWVRRRAGWLHAPAHETLSLAALGVSLLHTAQSVLAPESVRLELLRFAGPDLAAGWGLFVGVLALYLTAAATAAFYLRRYLGGWWRALHALAYAAYAASLWHALAIGANAWLPPLRWLYAASAGLLAAATALRVGEQVFLDAPAPV
jgi:methionine sulfoxide reductase heme-binding subunit